MSIDQMSRRMDVQITFGVTRDELAKLFAYYVDTINPEQNLQVVPNTRALASLITQILWMNGCAALDTWSQNEEVRAWADRCANRVWKSRRVRD